MSKQVCPGKRAAKLAICDSGNGTKKLAQTNIQFIVMHTEIFVPHSRDDCYCDVENITTVFFCNENKRKICKPTLQKKRTPINYKYYNKGIFHRSYAAHLLLENKTHVSDLQNRVLYKNLIVVLFVGPRQTVLKGTRKKRDFRGSTRHVLALCRTRASRTSDKRKTSMRGTCTGLCRDKRSYKALTKKTTRYLRFGTIKPDFDQQVLFSFEIIELIF